MREIGLAAPLLVALLGRSPVVAAQAPALPETKPAEPASSSDATAPVKALLEADKPAEAEAAARALLTEVEAKRGRDSLEAAMTLDLLVESLKLGKKTSGPEARTLAERAVTIKETVLGPESPDVAASLSRLASLLHREKDFPAAKEIYGRALSIREKAHGPDHVEVAKCLQGLGDALWKTGDRAGARAAHARSLAIREKASGPESLELAKALRSLAGFLDREGDDAAARPLYERALAIREKALGPEHLDVADALMGLGSALEDLREHRAALPVFKRALAIREKALGPEHLDVAKCLTRIGWQYWSLEDWARAKPVFSRLLAIRESALRPDDPELGRTIQQLGWTLTQLGDFARAKTLLERAAAIQEKASGPESAEYASALNDLAGLHFYASNVAEATRLFSRSVAIEEKLRGPDDPALQTTLTNFATALTESGAHSQARPLFERAIAIAERNPDRDLGELADSHGNLAIMLRKLGDYEAAERAFSKAKELRETASGPGHPDAAWILYQLALLHVEMGKLEDAVGEALRAEEVLNDRLRAATRSLSEAQSLTFGGFREPGIGLALTLAAEGLDAALREKILDVGIGARSLILDEVAARNRRVAEVMRATETPASTEEGSAEHAAGTAIAERWARVAEARSALASLAVRGSAGETVEDYRNRLREARTDVENAEEALAAASASFRQDRDVARLGLAAIRAALPKDAALIAFAWYEHVDLRRKTPGTKKQPPGWSYVACVLRGDGSAPDAVGLGAVAEIDRLVEAWTREAGHASGKARRSEAEAEAACRRAGEELRKRVWDPVVARAGAAKRVFVVPDGALNLVSFSALPAGAERYLVETGPVVHYLTTERDLASHRERARRGEGMLAIGGAEFDERSSLGLAASDGTEGASHAAPAKVASAKAFRGTRSACGELQAIRFAPLPETHAEVEEIADLWQRQGGALAKLMGRAASEAAVKEGAPGKRILHLATHGFFLDRKCGAAAEGESRGVVGLAATKKPQEPDPPGNDAAGAVENPLLLSGLALAGANLREEAGPDEEDGILTAEEIATLDLSGIEWAVLSACDTGLGDVKVGEGMFGLRRAFQVAGAGTVIMSLWSVEDESARHWMRELYRARLERKQDTAECVREASLAVLNARRAKGESTHPFYWAGFVAAGDWR